MLAAKHSAPAKLAARNGCANIALPPSAVRARISNVVQPYSIVTSHCCSASSTTERWTVTGRRARVAVANSAEVATAVTTTETGLKELDKDTFHDFINNAGDAVVVVDFFTDW